MRETFLRGAIYQDKKTNKSNSYKVLCPGSYCQLNPNLHILPPGGRDKTNKTAAPRLVMSV